MAKKNATSKRRPSLKSTSKSPSFWILLLCLLPVITLIWFLMQLEAGRDEVRRTDAVRQRKSPASGEHKPAVLKPPAPKYDFYHELPKGNASLPPSHPLEKKAKEQPKPEQAEKAKKSEVNSEQARANAALRGEVPPPRVQYFLQAGSFRKAEDAQRLRTKLVLLGQMTKLEQGKVAEQTWHRVLVGPFASAEQLKQAQGQLTAQGFKQLLPQKRQAN